MKRLSLYGVKVPAELYGHLKTVADILALHTYTNESLRSARKRAVLVALEAFFKMAKGI